jgi:CheY-like chemotaxis protein
MAGVRGLGHSGGMVTRVLVVDDSEPFRRAATELLAIRGFLVTSAVADVDSALSAVGSGCPDTVLLDINLATGDGYSASLQLTAACPRIRVVLTSSDVDEVGPAVLTACRASAFIPKAELATADLGAVLDHPRSQVTDPSS